MTEAQQQATDPLAGLGLEAVRAAAARIRPHARLTPVLTCAALARMAGAELFFKCENFQRAGAFKFRGACNAIFSLPDEELARGIATHSSGNHAAALALAARLRGTAAHIVMPRNAPAVKIAAVREYGGNITFCQPTLADREEALVQVMARTGAAAVHPYNDARVIAGQGTAVLELLEEVPNLDVVLTPVGGGGLLSGTALATRGLRPQAQVVGVEPAGADDACRSLQLGRIVPSIQPRTIADGLLTSLGELTFAVIRAHVDRIVTVDEAAIVAAMRHVWERLKIVIEPSAAVPVAAALAGGFAGRRVGIILSGGNVDLATLPFGHQEPLQA